MKLHKLHQKGDTILEVLVAVTVLSLVLTTSFGLATRSTHANRQAEERGEASKIAQAELEKLKLFLTSSGTGRAPTDGQYFCMKSDATAIIDLGTTGDIPDNANSDPNFTSSGYERARNLGCQAGVNNLYYRIIQKGSAAAGTANTYTAIVRWPAITGNGVDQVNMVHRIYPDEALLVTPAAAPCVVNSNVAISLDNSGSMDFSFTATTTRMQAAKSLLQDFFQTSDIRASGNRAALAEFAGAYYGPFLLQAMTSSYAQLRDAISRITTDPSAGVLGGTDIRRGLNVGYSELEAAQAGDPTATRVLVLITDGKQEGSGSVASIAQVKSRAAEIKNDGVVIYAVGIYPPGSPDEAAGSALLGGSSGTGGDDAVASAGGFSSASNPAELATILDNISSTLDC